MSYASRNDVHDLVGVGFGPAAIAVAAAFEDRHESLPPDGERLRTSYLDRAESSAWLPDLLLPGTDIQHHFLRDYATPRNPRSRFTFPNYLKETGRFYPFTLLGSYVTREEWSAYTLWTAGQLDQDVRYDTEVVDITPLRTRGRVSLAAVHYRDVKTGATGQRLARNVMLSTGYEPFVPDVFAPCLGDSVFHASQYLTKMRRFGPDAPLRVAVVGAGQTAGEIFLHLVQSYPHAQVYSLARNSGIRLYNLGHFANEAYFPQETDYFYALDATQRERVLQEQHGTNYSAVDPELSTAWYRTVYEDKFFGPGRLHMRKRTEVTSASTTPGGVRLELREIHVGRVDELEVDVAILCTGYRQPRLPSLVRSFTPFMSTDDAGQPDVTEAFRIVTTPECDVGLYVNGLTEWRHGINSAMSHSVMALRAGRIVDDVWERQTRPSPPVPEGGDGDHGEEKGASSGRQHPERQALGSG